MPTRALVRIPERWHPYIPPILLALFTVLHAFYVFCDGLSPAVTTSIEGFIIAQLCRLAFLLLAPYYGLQYSRVIKRLAPTPIARVAGDLLGVNATLLAGDALRLFWTCNQDYFLNKRYHRHHATLFHHLYYGVLISLPVIWGGYVMRTWDYLMGGKTWLFKRIPFRRRVREKLYIPPLESKPPTTR
ncbi:hypothetical protein BDZ89DRAFT_1058228 [Hymenopellis radicata]|nr:hypothetical protein BDZ89DRAFT_1058228 [Hymenopellis radicata]